MNFSQVRWQRVGLASVLGVITVLGATTAYGKYQMHHGVCVKYYPDGSEEILYGEDCGEFNLTPTTQGEDI